MDTKTRPDRRGTFWDWPVAVMVVAVLLLVLTDGRGVGLSFLLFVFGGLSLAIRRGAFTPRGR